MTDRFSFVLNKFDIFNTMAAHNDTDWVYFSATVGDQVIAPRHEKIGDLNNGTFWLNWELGPFNFEPDTPWSFHYQIVNHGHDDEAKQVSDDITIAEKIAGVAATVATAVGVVFPPAVIVGRVIAALGAAGEALKWLFTFANCDGSVLSDAVSGTGATLAGWAKPTGSHSETRNYAGPETPVGCGSNAQYALTWSVTWPDKPKESKEHKDKEKELRKDNFMEKGNLAEFAPVQQAPKGAPPKSPYPETPWDVIAV